MAPTVTNKLMSPEAALKKYGYVLDAASGLWRKDRGVHGYDASTEQWLPVSGGWLCFIAPRSGFGNVPFGWPVVQIGDEKASYISSNDTKKTAAPSALVGLVQVPVGLGQDWQQTSGLHPASHSMAYRWIWTDDEIAFMYGFAEPGWVKTQDPETGAITMTREKS